MKGQAQQNKKAQDKKGKGKGITTEPPRLSKQERKEAKAQGLRDPQYAGIRQRENMDLALGDYAQGMMPGIENAYSQPFDWNALPDWEQGPDWDSIPAAPVTGDYNNWRDEQINQSMAEFDAQMQPQFEKDQERFQQQMYNRGIPEGSEQYNRLYDQMVKSQSEARNSYLQSAREGAANDASQFFNIGQQARTGAIGEGLTRYGFGAQQRGDIYNEMMQQRNMPLNEYNQLMAARSPFDVQNLGYSQQRALQNDQFEQQKWMLKNTPTGGGGGGGGGAGALWQQYGFSSPMEYDAYKTAQARQNQQWDWANNPAYRQPSGPSYGAQLGGSILGAGLGILGGYAGANWF